MQEVMTAAYKTSARVYRQDLSIAPLASQGLPFLGVPLACRERGDRDMARLAAGLMPPMTGYWSRRYCSVGAEGEGFEPPDLSVSCFQDSRNRPLCHPSRCLTTHQHSTLRRHLQRGRRLSGVTERQPANPN